MKMYETMKKLTGPFPVSKVPGMEQEPFQVAVTMMDPVTIQPAASVEWAWDGSDGIIRGIQELKMVGGKPKWVLLEDHIDEIIKQGRCVKVGRRITGPGEMREFVSNIGQHLEAMRSLHPNWALLSAVGNGNLTCNPWFWTLIDGRLCSQQQEKAQLSSRVYSALIVRAAGSSPRVSIERVKVERGDQRYRLFSVSRGTYITDAIEMATTGQPIIIDGQPPSKQEFEATVLEGLFYDLRHVFLFGRYPLGKDATGKDRWLDVGLQPLWTHDGKLNADMITLALSGEFIPVDISGFDRDRVVASLTEKRYGTGEYRLAGDMLEVRLRPGIYPHNIIGVRKDGTLISVTMRGLSNRVGVTLEQAAETMLMLGAEQAMILDQGNDTFLNYCDDFVIGASEGLDKRLRSILVFKSDTLQHLKPDDMRLILYPKQ